MNKAKELARQHWGYVGMITERMYLDAFEHGYKHGRQDSADRDVSELKIHPTIDEQVIRHTEVPFDGDVGSQEDIKAFWAERARVASGE